MKRILIFFIALALIPVFAGLVCPCAMAEAPAHEALQKVPCHGCCPEIDAAPACRGVITNAHFSSSLHESMFHGANFLKALPSSGESIASDIQSKAPPDFKSAPPLFASPLYISLRVLRI